MIHLRSIDLPGRARTLAAPQDTEARWPGGWWILPAVGIGLTFWVLIFNWIASLF